MIQLLSTGRQISTKTIFFLLFQLYKSQPPPDTSVMDSFLTT
ncbi:hypothetical protein FQN60_016674 [Etheostoma spectabile]|uniref:Uncharacterized protein n=1 Tax=Etheostoma spectabile TaxID=54343 RepID=A0A5J5CZK7_9PERO|nr:hypothetical protein FQN60_016674 [Etheostoma spectabile]